MQMGICKPGDPPVFGDTGMADPMRFRFQGFLAELNTLEKRRFSQPSDS